jgi:sulfate adenylyltransferase
VSVALPLPELRAAVLADGALVLRDEELTPLAVLEDLTAQDGPLPTVTGRLRAARRRELRHASHPEVDFDAEELQHRPVLLMARPATRADVASLAPWAARHGAPLVLVAEQAPRHDRVPTGTLLRLAEALLDDLGVPGGEVLTVPFEGRDAVSDLRLGERVAARLRATDARALLEDSPDTSAQAWARSRAALSEGSPTSLAELPDSAADLLAGWRLPRSRRGLVVMFTGLSGSGKSTLARDLAGWVAGHTTRTVSLLDGDRVRRMLSSGLGFDAASRELNVRRIGYVAAEVARHGGIAICSPIAPSARVRAEVREMAEQVGDFLLVHVSTPLEECERRDLKGLYAAARQGTLADFTGISAPYDVPTDADLTVDTSRVDRATASTLVVDALLQGGWVEEVHR